MPPSHTRPTRSGSRLVAGRTATVATLLAVALTAAGCGGSDSSSPSAGPSGGGDQGGPPVVPSKVVLGRVAGNLHQPNKRIFKKHEKATLKQVGRAVDTWIDGGFVGVSYPRDDFGSAFTAFTAPARHDANGDRTLMTNWALRKKIDGVEVKKRKVTVDVLAPHGRPAGATARVYLVFATSGDVAKKVTVRGRLFLSAGDKGAWQVFGYDVSKGAR